MIPIRTNIWPNRRPYANYWLIGVTAVLFVLTYSPSSYMFVGARPVLVPIRSWAQPMMLIPAQWQPWQLVTYAFLHGGWLHILGNMFFLYIFGNNVNDKLGHLGYVLFYVAGAVFGGMGHTLLHSHSPLPTVGASGAVAAVTGAYLVLFPRSLITVLYWILFVLGTAQIPALWFIGLKMILLDNLIARTSPFIAYDAHLAGYAFGIGLTLSLLAVSILPRNHLDLWSMIVQWDRRRRYRRVVSAGYNPFTGRKHVRVREVPKTPEQVARQDRIAALRHQMSQRLAERNIATAARLYLDLMAIDDGQVLGRQEILDIANQLASEGSHRDAAKAYEQFLAHYGGTLYAEQVLLMAGLLYSRYLDRPDKATEYLRMAMDRLTDPSQRELCRQELARLGG